MLIYMAGRVHTFFNSELTHDRVNVSDKDQFWLSLHTKLLALKGQCCTNDVLDKSKDVFTTIEPFKIFLRFPHEVLVIFSKTISSCLWLQMMRRTGHRL